MAQGFNTGDISECRSWEAMKAYYENQGPKNCMPLYDREVCDLLGELRKGKCIKFALTFFQITTNV
jgi:hypothetical protein